MEFPAVLGVFLTNRIGATLTRLRFVIGQGGTMPSDLLIRIKLRGRLKPAKGYRQNDFELL